MASIDVVTATDKLYRVCTKCGVSTPHCVTVLSVTSLQNLGTGDVAEVIVNCTKCIRPYMRVTINESGAITAS